MNNDLKYNGKYLEQMTTNELKQQYELNRKRIIGNSAFLATVSGISLFYCPPIALVPIGIGSLRVYWINKNNKSLEEEANNRGMVLRKIKK